MAVNIQALRDAGLDEQQIQGLMNQSAESNYNSSSHGVNEWEGQSNNLNNLKSGLANLISNVYTAPEGTFTEQQVSIAKGYMEQMHEAGGIQNMNLTRADVNLLLTQGQEAVEHNPEYLGEDWNTLESAAAPIQNQESDEATYERVQAEGVADRNIQKPWTEEDNIVVNESSGTRFVRLENGTLEKYVDPGSDEYMESNIANSDEAFIANGGESTESGIFAGLTDK